MKPHPNTPLVIALTKGRIMEQVLPLLGASSIDIDDQDLSSGKLMIDSGCGNYRFLVLRGSDAATYVRLGAADLGMVGKDILLEFGYDNLYELLDLKLGRCKLMSAGLAGHEKPGEPLRVAAKYVNIAHDYYSRHRRSARIIPLYGSLELAPALGISDQIVDIVETGNTLKANGLVPLELIAHISVRLVANKAAMKFKYRNIGLFNERLGQHLGDEHGGPRATD